MKTCRRFHARCSMSGSVQWIKDPSTPWRKPNSRKMLSVLVVSMGFNELGVTFHSIPKVDRASYPHQFGSINMEKLQCLQYLAEVSNILICSSIIWKTSWRSVIIWKILRPLKSVSVATRLQWFSWRTGRTKWSSMGMISSIIIKGKTTCWGRLCAVKSPKYSIISSSPMPPCSNKGCNRVLTLANSCWMVESGSSVSNGSVGDIGSASTSIGSSTGILWYRNGSSK